MYIAQICTILENFYDFVYQNFIYKTHKNSEYSIISIHSRIGWSKNQIKCFSDNS